MERETFILQGEVVSKKNNNRYNPYTGRVYKKMGYIVWHKKALAEIMSQKKLCNAERELLLPLKKVSWVSMTFYHADNHRRDADNQATSVLDLLVEAGIIADDNHKILQGFSAINKSNNEAKCVIKIEYDEEANSGDK